MYLLECPDFCNLDLEVFFVNISVEHSPRGSVQELVDFPTAETDASSSTEIDHIESSNASTSTRPHMQDEITSTSGGVLLQNSSALVESNRTGQSGISMFQRYSLSTYMVVAAYKGVE